MKGISPKAAIEQFRQGRIFAHHRYVSDRAVLLGAIRYSGGAVIPIGVTDKALIADVTPSRNGRTTEKKKVVALEI